MGTLEIVLLIVGGAVFVLSFLIPAGGGTDKDTREQVETEVKNAVSKELDGIKGKIDDIVDETVNYAMEKTERALERVSNEKIMAVNEYSDTVLEDINKNHKEVMFLYDMLNDKHQNIKTTVSEVEKTVKEVELTAKEAVREVESARREETDPDPEDRLSALLEEQDKQAVFEEEAEETEDEGSEDADFRALAPQKVSSKKVIRTKPPKVQNAAEAPDMDISFMMENKRGGNNNERILELHNQGKSNVAIAKELGLGVGEVKLVIDLFEGM